MTPEERAAIGSEIADLKAVLRELRGQMASLDDVLKPARNAIRDREQEAWRLIFTGHDLETFGWSWAGFKAARAAHYDAIFKMRAGIAPYEKQHGEANRHARLLEKEIEALEHRLKVADGRGARSNRKSVERAQRGRSAAAQLSLFKE